MGNFALFCFPWVFALLAVFRLILGGFYAFYSVLRLIDI